MMYMAHDGYHYLHSHTQGQIIYLQFGIFGVNEEERGQRSHLIHEKIRARVGMGMGDFDF